MFKDRFDAGHQLLEKLLEYKDNPNVVVLAIPRGGLEVGYIIARGLHVPFDIILTKKIGYPGNPEYAIGAVSADHEALDPRIQLFGPEMAGYIEHEVKRLRQEIRNRYKKYECARPGIDLNGKTVIITDDGVATGQTLEVTLEVLKKSNPAKIIVALPVLPREALKRLEEHGYKVIYSLIPQLFLSVGQFYEKFDQVEDTEALELLREGNLLSSHKV
ncbi:MAG TPA: phosphoribosyltransferase family protein [Candidatus Babeliaceae bacterium]|nr:phosphoribosyltransferase family protein [Candidatus Babeliaceae bacterium]